MSGEQDEIRWQQRCELWEDLRATFSFSFSFPFSSSYRSPKASFSAGKVSLGRSGNQITQVDPIPTTRGRTRDPIRGRPPRAEHDGAVTPNPKSNRGPRSSFSSLATGFLASCGGDMLDLTGQVWATRTCRSRLYPLTDNIRMRATNRGSCPGFWGYLHIAGLRRMMPPPPWGSCDGMINRADSGITTSDRSCWLQSVVLGGIRLRLKQPRSLRYRCAERLYEAPSHAVSASTVSLLLRTLSFRAFR